MQFLVKADCRISLKADHHKRRPRGHDVAALGEAREVAHSNLGKVRYGAEARVHGSDIVGVYLHALFVPFSDVLPLFSHVPGVLDLLSPSCAAPL